MKRLLLSFIILTTVVYVSCNKADIAATGTDTDFKTLEQTTVNDFTNNVAVSGYLKLSVAAANLNSTIQTLNTATTDANLLATREAWKSMREIWEQCEGFLFGPVEDNDYDPNMDTWPTDYSQLDSLLASKNALEVTDIQSFTLSLRGLSPDRVYYFW